MCNITSVCIPSGQSWNHKGCLMSPSWALLAPPHSLLLLTAPSILCVVHSSCPYAILPGALPFRLPGVQNSPQGQIESSCPYTIFVIIPVSPCHPLQKQTAPLLYFLLFHFFFCSDDVNLLPQPHTLSLLVAFLYVS